MVEYKTRHPDREMKEHVLFLTLLEKITTVA
jgi:hypothetical protein